jgi:hypothetical protein
MIHLAAGAAFGRRLDRAPQLKGLTAEGWKRG